MRAARSGRLLEPGCVASSIVSSPWWALSVRIRYARVCPGLRDSVCPGLWDGVSWPPGQGFVFTVLASGTLVTAWQALNEDCRGGAGYDASPTTACDRRAIISKQL